MTFYEALKKTIHEKKSFCRKVYHFEKGGYHCTEWSMWIRMRLDDDAVDEDALVYFESNNLDEEQGYWTRNWSEDQLSRADVMATDWQEFELWQR
jgi:hypothetical protein